MKKNCFIKGALALANLMATKNHFACSTAEITSDGDLVFTQWNKDDQSDSERMHFYPNEIAYKINMPLWEVCMIEVGGDDEYAIMFYEGE